MKSLLDRLERLFVAFHSNEANSESRLVASYQWFGLRMAFKIADESSKRICGILPRTGSEGLVGNVDVLFSCV